MKCTVQEASVAWRDLIPALKGDLQFIVEDFSVAQSPGPVHHGSKNGTLAGRMVV
jgi:hypothetical protein